MIKMRQVQTTEELNAPGDYLLDQYGAIVMCRGKDLLRMDAPTWTIHAAPPSPLDIKPSMRHFKCCHFTITNNQMVDHGDEGPQ